MPPPPRPPRYLKCQFPQTMHMSSIQFTNETTKMFKTAFWVSDETDVYLFYDLEVEQQDQGLKEQTVSGEEKCNRWWFSYSAPTLLSIHTTDYTKALTPPSKSEPVLQYPCAGYATVSSKLRSILQVNKVSVVQCGDCFGRDRPAFHRCATGFWEVTCSGEKCTHT